MMKDILTSEPRFWLSHTKEDSNGVYIWPDPAPSLEDALERATSAAKEEPSGMIGVVRAELSRGEPTIKTVAVVMCDEEEWRLLAMNIDSPSAAISESKLVGLLIDRKGSKGAAQLIARRKMGECGLALHLGLDPDKVVNWDVSVGTGPAFFLSAR
jgi:hypothetical protein